MKKLKVFASTLILAMIMAPTTAFADGGYRDNNASDAFLAFIMWTVIIIVGILGLFSIVVLVAYVLDKLGVIKLPPDQPER